MLAIQHEKLNKQVTCNHFCSPLPTEYLADFPRTVADFVLARCRVAFCDDCPAAGCCDIVAVVAAGRFPEEAVAVRQCPPYSPP